MDSYRYWERQLSRNDFSYGQFGENFTVEGLPDLEVCIGDRYRIGAALFEVSQPRVTCYRLGIRMGEPQMAALMVAHHRPGFYFRVLDLKTDGASLPIAAYPHIEEFFGGRVPTKPAADAPLHGINALPSVTSLPASPWTSLTFCEVTDSSRGPSSNSLTALMALMRRLRATCCNQRKAKYGSRRFLTEIFIFRKKMMGGGIAQDDFLLVWSMNATT